MFALILAKNGVRWFSKVNAEKKFGVDFLFLGVLTQTRKVAKKEQIACTKAWEVCKNQAFSPQFLIMRGFPQTAKRPLFVPDCIVSVNFFLFERF
ncbi:MAG: hypothetical protein IKI19_07395 [Prevotella sp.]|nr:hypothetical protein [Prevotella sp.]